MMHAEWDSVSEEEEIYRENILDHYRHPHNMGELTSCTVSHHELNPLCGDELTMYLVIEDNVIKDAKFSGHGCAISVASASMLTDKIKGMPVEKLVKLTEADISQMLGITLSVVRMKCGMLSLKAAMKAVEKKQ